MGKEKLPGKKNSGSSLSAPDQYMLILHNDDVHTFEYVINALVEVFSYTPEQAEQITHLVHYKGHCEVKKGSYEKLKPLRDQLYGRELNVTIE